MKKTSRPSSAASTQNLTSKTVKNHAKTINTTAKKTNEKKKTETEEEKFLDFEDFLDTENFFLKVEEAQTTEINVKMNKAAPKESQFSSAVAEGEVNMKLHNWQKALNAFTRAVSLGPKSKHVLVCRSKCYQNLGRFDLAIQDADTALSYDTNYYKGFLQKAEALYASGQFEFALVYYYKGFALRKDIQDFTRGIRKAKIAINESIEQDKLDRQNSYVFPAGDLSTTTPMTPLSFTFATTPPSPVRTISTLQGTSQSSLNASSLKLDLTRRKQPKREDKTLLSEFAQDEKYLKELMNDKTFERSINGVARKSHVHNLVSNTLQYLDKRKEFWRHSSPNPEQHKNLLSPRGPSSVSLSHISTFRDDLISPRSPTRPTFPSKPKSRPQSASTSRQTWTTPRNVTKTRPQSSAVKNKRIVLEDKPIVKNKKKRPNSAPATKRIDSVSTPIKLLPIEDDLIYEDTSVVKRTIPEQVYEQYLESPRGNEPHITEKIQTCIREGDYRTAEKIAKDLINTLEIEFAHGKHSRIPKLSFADVYTSLGSVLLKLRRNSEAVEAYQKAVTFTYQYGYRQAYSRALTNLALVQESLDAYPEAISVWRQKVSMLLDRRPKDPDIELEITLLYEIIGNCLQKTHQTEEASEHYLKASEELSEIISSFVQANEDEESVKTLREKQRNVIYSLSKAYRELGRYEEAIKNLERFLELTRKCDDISIQAKALTTLGNVYSEMYENETNTQQAAEYQNKALYYQKMAITLLRMRNNDNV